MTNQAFVFVLVPFAVFVVSLLGTALMRRLAMKYGWTALPRDDRWALKNPTALHGGVGFYPAFLFGMLLLLSHNFNFLDEWHGIHPPGIGPQELGLALTLLLGSLFMFLFGLWDDLKQARPATKFVFQLIAASAFIYAGGIFPLTGVYIVDVLVTYFWFVGITNSINMLDNMDGLASGVVILAGLTLVVLAFGVTPLAWSNSLGVGMGLVFVAAVLGFWVDNHPPAKIFMGDSGSLFLGYTLAAMAVPSPLNGFLGIHEGELFLVGPLLVLVIPATVLAVPIFDTTLVTITRKWRARKASQGGQDHSSHRLVGLGFSEIKTVWLLYAFSALGGIVAVLMQNFPAQALPLLGFFVLVLILTGVYLGHVKVRTTDPDHIPPAWTPLVSKLLYKQPAVEVLLDTILIVICFYGAYLLRFEGSLSLTNKNAIVLALPILVPSCLLMYFLAGIYQRQWRLISVSDMSSYALGVFGGAGISLVIVTLLTQFNNGHSYSAYIIFGVLNFLAVFGSRLSFRLFDSVVCQNGLRTMTNDQKSVLIYGAAMAGKILHEEVSSNPEMKDYVVLGFVDEDPNRVGRRLCGVPIKKGFDWMNQRWNHPPEIWISSRFISDQQARKLAHHWNGQATVRRVQLQIGKIRDLPNASTQLISSLVDSK